VDAEGETTPSVAWISEKSHWYGFPYIGQVMANGNVYTGEEATVAIREDLQAVFPLGSRVWLFTACGWELAEVTDLMPVHSDQPQVIVDVSPYLAGRLFCQGYGYNERGVAYGEEAVTVWPASLINPHKESICE
jgi:hypothetical protein